MRYLAPRQHLRESSGDYWRNLITVILMYLEVITWLFLHRHLYQAERRQLPEAKLRAVVDRGLDIGADMKTPVL